jgi:hypothetical protein
MICYQKIWLNYYFIDSLAYALRLGGGHFPTQRYTPDGQWDEDKLTIEQALQKYPIAEYEWIHFED